MEKIKNFVQNFLNAERDTQIRTIAFFIVLINLVLKTFFKKELELDADTVLTWVLTAATVVTGIWSWWKNNSFSEEAKKHDALMRAEKKSVFDEETPEDEFVTEDEE